MAIKLTFWAFVENAYVITSRLHETNIILLRIRGADDNKEETVLEVGKIQQEKQHRIIASTGYPAPHLHIFMKASKKLCTREIHKDVNIKTFTKQNICFSICSVTAFALLYLI